MATINNKLSFVVASLDMTEDSILQEIYGNSRC